MISAAVTTLHAFPADDTHGGIVVRANLALSGSCGRELSIRARAADREIRTTVLRDSARDDACVRRIRVSFTLDVELDDSDCVELSISEHRLLGTGVCSVGISHAAIAQALELQEKLMLHAQAAPHHEWMLAHRPDVLELNRQREEISRWNDEQKPLVSIVTPVFNPPLSVLSAMIDSVIAQTYENWELLLANASGEGAEVTDLLNSYSDSRIHVFSIPNRSIAENSNEAIERSCGKYIAFVDHDDLIEPDALYQYMQVLREHPTCDLLFCDEDLCCEDSPGCLSFYGPRFKPGWNYDLALTHNYICHLLMVSRWALDRTERSEVDVSAAQDYDLTFKVAEIAREIRHIPKVLYHWRESNTSTARNRDSKPYALEAGRLAVQHHLDRCGIEATVHIGAFPFSYRIQYHLPDPAVGVSLVIAFDGKGDIARALRSICEVTEYPWDRYEIIVATSVRYRRRALRAVRDTMAARRGTSSISCLVLEADSSHFDIVGASLSRARFETVVSLDAYCEAVEGNWLTELIEPLRRTDVALSAPLLLDGDGLVNAFGLTVGEEGSLVPVGTGMQLTDFGYMSIMFHARDCDIVPRVGAAFRRSDWLKWARTANVQSFEAYCLDARERGMKIVVEPYGPLRVWRDVGSDSDSPLLCLPRACEREDSYLSPWLNPMSGYFALK